MKKILFTIVALVFVSQVFAQRNINPDRVKAQKVAFITERLDLSSDEAAKFWPIYNAFEDKTNDIRQNDLREVRRAMRQGNLSDSEAQKLLDTFMAAEEKLHQAKKDLVSDLKNVIAPQKIIALKAAEDAFNQRLLQILQQRKEKMQQRKGNRN